jgi:hypothetical protein
MTPPSDSTDKDATGVAVRRYEIHPSELSAFKIRQKDDGYWVPAADYLALQGSYTEACRDLEDQRERYIRLKDELKRVCTKSNEWKLRYKSERGSWQDAIHKAKCKVDALQARYDKLQSEAGALKAQYSVLRAAAELMVKFINRHHIDDGSQRVLDVYAAATASQAMPDSGEGRE